MILPVIIDGYSSKLAVMKFDQLCGDWRVFKVCILISNLVRVMDIQTLFIMMFRQL